MTAVKKVVGKSLLWVFGWQAEITVDLPKKYIVVGYPHTSTWDFPLFVLTIWSMGIPMKFLGKKSLFVGPFGWLFTALGGLPVDRTGGKDMVKQVAQLFEDHDELSIGLAPSGTRGHAEHLRSGFYHMAAASDVPLVLGSMDFGRRVGCLIDAVHPSGDIGADMDKIRKIYTHIRGRNPELMVPIRLRSELEE
ncbi:MAG: glycerol acyltransferase [Deltaproteobacteria bacterium]|nr:glycerol acyltransferase [Deltaproteobacteria bacterium]|tara:strand:- start:35 stop:613 length:579 start_codon:yes stop_codon:yes gene_type:complete